MQIKRYPYSMEKSRELTIELFEELKDYKDDDKYIIIETSGTHPSRVMKFITNDLIDKLVIVVEDVIVYKYNSSCILKSTLLAINNDIDFEIIFRLSEMEEEIVNVKHYQNLIDQDYITIE